MIKYSKLFQVIAVRFWLFSVILIFAGCAHDAGPEHAVIAKTLHASSTFEKKGDLFNSVEELKIALAINPGNSELMENLNWMVVKRNQEADRHFMAGLDMRDSNPPEARKELLAALRIRNDHPEAVAVLRQIQLNSAEAVVMGRPRKESKVAATRMPGKTVVVEEEETAGEAYSLDTAMSSFERNDYDTAIREFTKMKARYPNDPDIQLYLDRSWYNSGIALFTKKDYQRSLNSFTNVSKGFEYVDDYMAKCRAALKKNQ